MTIGHTFLTKKIAVLEFFSLYFVEFEADLYEVSRFVKFSIVVTFSYILKSDVVSKRSF